MSSKASISSAEARGYLAGVGRLQRVPGTVVAHYYLPARLDVFDSPIGPASGVSREAWTVIDYNPTNISYDIE
jgi:hypothetical protein